MDGDAERLAMELSGAFMAPEELYESISADLARIRAVIPATANIHQFPSFWPGVSVGFEPDSGVDTASYAAWDCLNAYYGARMSHRYKFISAVAFDFAPWIDTRQLAADYATLPQVRYAVSNMLIGDGSDICLVTEGDSRAYIFDDASGDCSAGCTVSHYYAAKVEADGGVTRLGEWHPEDGGWTLPEWFTSRPACTKNL